jgi:two-component system response regulator YesN
VQEALLYIKDHLNDPALHVGAIAEHVGMHRNYLGQLFAAETGKRVCRYVTERRIERAQALLKSTTWQVKLVATECGFANANWFCHVFCAHSGETPAEYRRRHFRPPADPSNPSASDSAAR